MTSSSPGHRIIESGDGRTLASYALKSHPVVWVVHQAGPTRPLTGWTAAPGA
jgi:hypothetical protein